MDEIDRLDQWFKHHYDELCKIAAKYSGEPEDLLHHVYLKTRRSGTISAMLDSCPMSYMRKALWREANMGSYLRLMRKQTGVMPEQEGWSWQSRELLYIAIDRLPEPEKQLMYLSLWGCSIAEISTTCRIPESTLYARYRRIRHTLKSMIDEDHIN